MNKRLLVLIVFLLGACAANEEDERPDAIDDFIAVSELEEVRVIRSLEQFGQNVINDYYVIVTTRKEQFLLAYPYACSWTYDTGRRPDRRRDPHAIYADTDTFRGCRIKAMYPITEAQVAELMEMGRAPGQR